jgi:hypothetical protein
MEWLQTNWVQVGVIAFAIHTALKAIAEAIDKDPKTDNKFERAIKFFGNLIGYLFGKRK